jgi:hypothetical protein
VVGPADQQLCGHDWADRRLGEQGRPCGLLLDEIEQLRIEFGELLGWEPNPCRDRLQTEHAQAVLDRRRRRSLQLLDSPEFE